MSRIGEGPPDEEAAPAGTYYGAPGEIRTPGLLVRSQTLYPAELRAHSGSWMNLCQINKKSRTVQLTALCRGHGLGGRLGRDQGQFLFDVKPCLAHQPGHRGGIQTGRVVLHTQGARRAIECEATNTVDIPDIRQRKRDCLGWRGTVAIENVHLRHIRG